MSDSFQGFLPQTSSVYLVSAIILKKTLLTLTACSALLILNKFSRKWQYQKSEVKKLSCNWTFGNALTLEAWLQTNFLMLWFIVLISVCK